MLFVFVVWLRCVKSFFIVLMLLLFMVFFSNFLRISFIVLIFCGNFLLDSIFVILVKVDFRIFERLDFCIRVLIVLVKFINVCIFLRWLIMFENFFGYVYCILMVILYSCWLFVKMIFFWFCFLVSCFVLWRVVIIVFGLDGVMLMRGR